ncbi:E3 ubiquitin-protein ligase RSL1-like [Mercurialis annua]|uniref:E3 ubiquitin-protein ligase RSL1-like n=1 Tax=Mercurialis annua TaxID=3986 RepID=UPI00215F31BA|nr:E3 ubiquitin-protein ligase RSL1-like [Mercurialis annua]
MATTTNIMDDDVYLILAEQRRELTAAQFIDSDLDFAYQLQLQEAINASLVLLPSSSTSQPPQPPQPENDAVASSSFPSLQSEELAKLEQELNDRKQSELEARKIRDDLNRRIHDQKLAREIVRIPEDDWGEWGDEFEKPYQSVSCSSGAASSSKSGVIHNEESVFRIYFKGLISEETVDGKMVNLGGIGVAICDPDDNLVFEIRKPLIGNGMGKQAIETKALIEGLSAAIALELKRVVIHCHYHPLYQFIIGRWPAKQRKVAALVNQVSLLRKEFTMCRTILVPHNDIKYAFKLAKDAIVSQVTRPAEPSHGKTFQETCVICLEDTDAERIFSVDECQHRYCFPCMKQHVEVKLLHGMVPKCPHDACKSELTVDSCSKFLTSKLIEMMIRRIKEASIPVSEKIYCPYPKCSVLMSRSEVSDGSERSSARKCLKCHGLFCIDCKVPWHSNMTCIDYKILNPNPPAEELKLKSLATRNLWRQCVKCNHMIELAEGCYHMTCRCGYEFCYNCGAEWKGKKPTCSCPIWDEDYILGNRLGSDDEEEDFEFDDDDDDEDFYVHDYHDYADGFF